MRRVPPARRAGIALVAVLCQLTLLFMAWGMANRQCAATIGIAEALARREERRPASLAALAAALAALERGVPPESAIDPDSGAYRCTVEVFSGGALRPYTLPFEPTDRDAGAWSVSAVPSDPDADADLGPLGSVPFE